MTADHPTQTAVGTHLFLTGFMGCGKSTVGPLLAQRLERHFIDLDALIEAAAAKSIPRIFSDAGEAGFRQLEREMLARCLRLPPAVIALGGGTLTGETNRAQVRSNGRTIWLRISLELCRSRCLGDRKRPLAQDLLRFETLYHQRQSQYQCAEWVVDVDNKTPQQITQEILFCLFANFNGNKHPERGPEG